MDIVKLDKEKFRLGHTLVFFRAGIGGWMEEQRENKIGSVLAWLQAGARGKTARMQFKKLQDQKMALYACQRAIRSYMMAKTWLWLQLWLSIKLNRAPGLASSRRSTRTRLLKLRPTLMEPFRLAQRSRQSMMASLPKSTSFPLP